MIINEKIARESLVKMRTRRPMDGRIQVAMEHISHDLERAGWPQLKEGSLRMVAHRHIQLARNRS